ncbi:MAG: response regulator [Desulfobacteraceae bacterium]|jgi:two-component system sensor histidine kinase/response regulator|nr:response regulator [Desulfobacteraceae bacterium]
MIPDESSPQTPDIEAGEPFRKQFSISKSLTVGLTLVVLAVSVVAISLNFYFSTQASIQSLEKKADEYASFLSSSLKLSLWEFDTRSIRHIGSAFAQNEFIDILEIYDADGVKVFSNKARSESDVFLERSRNIYYENQPAGSVYLSLTPGHYKKFSQQLLLSSAMTILIILLALFIATGLLLRIFLRKPLNKLSQTVADFASGHGRAKESDVSCIEFQGFVNILYDMELRIEQQMAALKTAREKYQGIFEHAAQGIFQISPEGVLISANPAMADILGFESPDALVGRKRSVWQKGFADQEHLASLRKGIKKSEISGLETRMTRKDKTLIWVSISVKSIFDSLGRLKYNEGFLLDITEKKAREKAERERESARLALKAKSDFLANMSHEIRTPMNAIIGLVHLALKTDLTAKQYDYLSKIRQSADALLRIINDILDFSKIEAGMLTMESIDFNLESVMGNLINVASLEAEKKGLEFIFHIEPGIPLNLVGDPLRLEQVLINLSSNAVKFTEKGHIIIRVRPDVKNATGPDHVRFLFEVEDTGIGLSDEQKSRLFQSFSQADDSVTRKFGGTGLGLAICKRLVELMKGTIHMDSEQGKGSTFYFDAVFGTKAGKVEKPFIPPHHLKDLKVLVVDDNKVARFVICDMLESFSFEVHQVSSARESFIELENAAKNNRPFELVVMDWRMPEIDGVEASRRIKTNDGLSRIPSILMLTAYSRDDIRKKAEGVGVDGFLAKPVNMSLLFDIIIEILSKTTDSKKQLLAAEKSEEVPGLDKIRGASILLVEDNEINRQVATELLESEGLIVQVAVNGKKALDKLSDPEFVDTFDLVLMDIQMPEMDGITATRKIRNLDMPVSKIPILAMTAHALAYEREKCIEAGMNDHIPKPIDPNRLFAALVEWIKPKTEVPLARPERQLKDPEASVLPDQLSGFDLDAGLSRVAGNRTLFRDLLFKFAEKQTRIMEGIQSAIAARDFTQALEIAHKIKGMAGNMGAMAVYNAANELESTLKGEIITEMDDALDRFSDEYKIAVDSIVTMNQSSVDSAEKRSTPSASTEHFIAIIKKIGDLIRSDYGAALKTIEILKEMVGGTDLEEDVKQLARAIEEFDEDNTKIVLERLGRKTNVALSIGEI